MSRRPPIVIALQRPTGYAGVHPELVIEGAMRSDWKYEFLRDEGAAVILAVDRPEGYERVAATTVGRTP